MYKKEKNFCLPPLDCDFWELFDYFWDNGVGNNVTEEGDPQPWTTEAFALALDSEPSTTSVGNWRSRKHLPRKEQIQRFCRILFIDEPSLRKAWSSVLIKARREEELLRKIQKKEVKIDETSTTFDESSEDATGTTASEHVGETTQEASSIGTEGVALWRALYIAVLLSVLFFLFRSNDQFHSRAELSVYNIRFCLEQEFSQRRLSCNANQSHFPEGTQKVYVSFETDNIPHGLAFSRRWYRNSDKFMERNDFFDETWQNYTWLYNKNGHDTGEYSMRIIMEDQVFTGEFTLGET